MGLNNLSDWDRSGTLSPYPQSAGSQGISAIAALMKIFQQQQQDKALRTAAGGMMGGEQVPAGVDAGKLYSDLAVNKYKKETPQSPNEMQTLIDFISKGQGVGGVLNGATQGTEMPGTVPAIPPVSSMPSPDLMLRGIMSKKLGIPYEAMATPEEKQIKQQDELSMVKQKADIAEKARGIDPMYKKQVEIFKDVLKHRGELEGLLFNQNQFQPGVKSWNPTRKENQRIKELLNEAQTAKKLLSARNVQGEDTSKMSIPGVGNGISMFANPEAMKMNLDDLYTTIQAAKENIEPGGQVPVQGNTFATEQEALASGIKGEVIIGGRRARID